MPLVLPDPIGIFRSIRSPKVPKSVRYYSASIQILNHWRTQMDVIAN